MLKAMNQRQTLSFCLLCGLLLTACGGVVDPVIRAPGTGTTAAPRPSDTPVATATDEPSPTSPRPTAAGGPTATSILGPTRTPLAEVGTSTPRPNPNAPRIEVFTADPAYVYPGDDLTLFWSIRGADTAAIYRLDDLGQRNQLWNVGPDGSLVVQTARNDRGLAEFLLTVTSGQYYVEQLLAVPLLCAYEWFFVPEPTTCAATGAVESRQIEQVFEGGRMIFVEEADLVYILFADGLTPAWTSFQNRYVPGTSPEQDDNFVPPPDRYQPVRQLGMIWRASDPVRNRLALGLIPETIYEGAFQADAEPRGETIFLRSADGSVLQLDPDGESWSIIAPP
jgi:hypothetical protein